MRGQIFTKAILEGLTTQTGTTVTDKDITKLTQPKLIGDVLILPVSAFGSGQDHSGSKPLGNEDQLMAHHFRGFQNWKLAHKPLDLPRGSSAARQGIS